MAYHFTSSHLSYLYDRIVNMCFSAYHTFFTVLKCVYWSTSVQSRCWRAFVYTYPVTNPSPDVTADLKNDGSHHFPALTPPWLMGRTGSCQAQSGMRPGIRRPGILPLCLWQAADWQWLPGWQPFQPASPCPGFQMLLQRGDEYHHFLLAEHGSTPSESGCSAAAVSVVWMTRYYGSCSDNGSCTPGAIKVIHLLSPSVSTTNLQLWLNLRCPLVGGKWAPAWGWILLSQKGRERMLKSKGGRKWEE